MMKNYFNEELVITKEDNEDFENSIKYWTCDSDYVDGEVKVRYHCHIAGKYRDSAHRDCNINRISQPKNYDSHLILQELGKFNLKINVIRNGLEKYMSFTINNKLRFIGNFNF